MQNKELIYESAGEVDPNVGAIIGLVIGVGIATLILIFIGVLSGSIYSQIEPDLDELGGTVLNESLGTASADGILSGTLVKFPVVAGSETLWCNSTALAEGNYTLVDSTGVFALNGTETYCNKTFVFAAPYQYGDPISAGYVKDSIQFGFKAFKQTGNYLPIVVMAVIITIVLALVMGLGAVTTPPSGYGGYGGHGGVL